MPAETQFCTSCGTRNDSDAVFCEECGQSLAATEAGAGSPAGGHAESTSVPWRPPRWLVALVAILLVLGGGAYALRAPFSSLLASMTSLASRAAPDSGGPKPPAATTPKVPPPAETKVVVSGDSALRDTASPIEIQIAPQPTRSSAKKHAPVKATVAKRDTAKVRRGTVEPLLDSPATSSAPAPRPAATPSPQQSTPTQPTPTPMAPATTASSPIGPPAPARTPAPPAGPAPTPGPPPSAGRIGAGSVLSLKATDKVCTDKNKEGDRFRAAVQQPVQGSNGAMIPKGAVVTFVIDRLRRADGSKPLEFSVAAQSIELGGKSHPLSVTVDTVAMKKKGRGLLGALAGAAVGAAVTGAAGGSTKEAVAGGAVGGAAGAVVGGQLKTGDGCIDKNALMRVTLVADLTPR